MIDVARLRYGDVLVPEAGAAGHVYVYLGRERDNPRRAALLVVTPDMRGAHISYLWLANPMAWRKVP